MNSTREGGWNQTREMGAALRKAARYPQPGREEKHVLRPHLWDGVVEEPARWTQIGKEMFGSGNMGCSRTRQCHRSPAVEMDRG